MALLELAVRDLALIERARIELDRGLTVITGETGAGKSLLIDALSLVLGGRSDSGLIRHGADRLRVEAVFEREPEPLICVREVAANGRSLARLDDETVTAARLAGEVGALVEIHGQHEQQRLLSGSWQRDVLDAYGGHEHLRQTVGVAVAEWRANEAALAELAAAPDEVARRIELAEHAASEIEVANPQPGEVERLRSRLSALASSERIAGLLAEAHSLLNDERGARDRVALAARATAELARLDPTFGPESDRMAGLAAELEDAALELRRRQDERVAEGSDAGDVEERLGVLYGLLRKYGPDEEAVIAHGEASRAEVERLRDLDRERARRQVDAERLAQAAQQAAARLTRARDQAARRLARAVTDALIELGFPQAAFEVSLEPAALAESGADAVAFLLAPNPGEPPRPLARIASGGEMSRVALAIKGVLARADATPTLVFDEVDAGIGGRSADPVGRSLWRLARTHQVICVTHLPQIAAHADRHLRIDKQSREGRTVTVIEVLDEEARLMELAAMLGGGDGAAARAAAVELLDRARQAHDQAAAA
ncbi:MAG TPA: DNA repair protein RecN [Candidatus Limnocylindrales bacterium]|nr:DNA repair protein RecN [Candidatus Limnocylindrales bacterium]